MEKLFYTVGELSEILSESTSLVRYWSNVFSKFLKLSRNAKGNRQFFPQDVETMKKIHYLIKVEGLTLEGTAKQLAADRKDVEYKVKALDSLKEIKETLVEIRKSL